MAAMSNRDAGTQRDGRGLLIGRLILSRLVPTLWSFVKLRTSCLKMHACIVQQAGHNIFEQII